MTKYILHGGMTRVECEKNDNFFRKLFNSAKNGKILISYFSSPKGEWPRLYAEDKEKFKKAAGGNNFELILTDGNGEIFIEQVEMADVVYFRGGSNYMLMDKLRDVKEKFIRLIEGKTVVGSSAGANMISKYYYSTDVNKIEEGFGFLPIKVYCHYKGNERLLEELKIYKENMKTYAIPETEFIVINK